MYSSVLCARVLLWVAELFRCCFHLQAKHESCLLYKYTETAIAYLFSAISAQSSGYRSDCALRGRFRSCVDSQFLCSNAHEMKQCSSQPTAEWNLLHLREKANFYRLPQNIHLERKRVRNILKKSFWEKKEAKSIAVPLTAICSKHGGRKNWGDVMTSHSWSLHIANISSAAYQHSS